jgi:lipoprotein-releasing system permease protein
LILLFLFEGAILCLVGVVIGIIFGLLISSAANYFNWIELPAEVYSISSVRLIPKLSEVLLISMSVMLMGVIATLYPAWQASRIKPLENLRHS